MKRLTLDNAFAIAKERGGTCVSTEYINASTPMRWKCANSHEWTATLNNIKNGKRWCPHCAVNRPLTIENAKQLARSKNGLCISTEYINVNTPMQWQCTKGHVWTTTLHSIKNHKTWCPHCANNKPCTLEDAKQVACNRNGLCISTEYINANTPMQWRCSEGHEWNASFNNIKNGKKWCPHCAGNRPLTIENAKQLACNRNGICLSKYFTNSRSALLWKCAEGHLWTASFSSVKHSNSWCPFCSKYKREKICREIVSKYLGPPSKIRRPDFLKTPKYYQGLELDIPYYDYGFAIEVQGEQHEKFNKFFHRGDPNNFIKQQERDQLKKELCEENRIALRYVWYYEDPYVVIPEHLRELGLIDAL